MGIWDNIENVDVFQRGSYFEPGQYEAEVLQCKENNGHKGEAFIVELKILSTTNPKLPVGCTASWVRKFDTKEKAEMSKREIVAFMVAALGHEITKQNVEKIQSVIKQLIPRVVGEENMLAGRVVKVEAFQIETKAGNPFTQVRWFPKVDAA